jgi:DNA-binding MarR family transcriptional regulator
VDELMGTATHADVVERDRHRWRERGLPDPDAMAGFMAFSRAYVRVQEAAREALEPLDLSIAQFAALAHLELCRPEPRSMGEISSRLLISPARLTTVVGRLEARGLVARSTSPVDRRSTLVEITATGRECIARAAALLSDCRFGLASLDAEQLAQFTGLLGEVRRGGGDPDE